MKSIFCAQLLLIALCLCLSSHALALRESPFPSSPQKNLTDDTRFTHTLFSIVIPKGWSVNPEAPSDKLNGGLTSTPVSDIKTSETYLGIHIRREAPSLTLEQRKANFDAKGKESKFVTWQGHRWLLSEAAMDSAAGNPLHTWAAFMIAAGTELLIVAGTPKTQLAKHQSTLLKIMESVSLSKK